MTPGAGGRIERRVGDQIFAVRTGDIETAFDAVLDGASGGFEQMLRLERRDARLAADGAALLFDQAIEAEFGIGILPTAQTGGRNAKERMFALEMLSDEAERGLFAEVEIIGEHEDGLFAPEHDFALIIAADEVGELDGGGGGAGDGASGSGEDDLRDLFGWLVFETIVDLASGPLLAFGDAMDFFLVPAGAESAGDVAGNKPATTRGGAMRFARGVVEYEINAFDPDKVGMPFDGRGFQNFWIRGFHRFWVWEF